MLFLMAAGLTLVFGVMDLINLAHGSFYMLGAYLTAALLAATGSLVLAVAIAVPLAALIGLVVELVCLRTLYGRDHLDQVLATFGLILFFNEAVRWVFGPTPLFLSPPPWLAGQVDLLGAPFPAIRLAILAVGLAVAAGLWWLIARTRSGALIRAGASNRAMLEALGVDVGRLFTLVFALGAGLAGLAGAMAGMVLAVQVGMGEDILILAFVVIVIGGLGSVRGAFLGALVVGVVDTGTRALLPTLLRTALEPTTADALSAGLASMSVYVLMAAVLIVRPRGLFPAGA